MNTYTTMKNAITRKLDRDQLRDVANHGADAGWPGFCYYSETCKFAKKYRGVILNALLADCADMGVESPAHMVQSFRCVGTDYSLHEINSVLYGMHSSDDAQTTILNALAWYALERVAREFDR